MTPPAPDNSAVPRAGGGCSRPDYGWLATVSGVRRENLRVARGLVLLGFLLVGVSDVPLLLSYLGSAPLDQTLFWIFTGLGFAVLGCASWAWLSALSRDHGDAAGLCRVLRLFASACGLLGLAYLTGVREIVRLHGMQEHFGLRTLALNDGLSILGFALASLGFWLAGGAVRPGPPVPVESYEAAPTAR